MKSVGRIVPQTNAHYVELLKKLVKLITKGCKKTLLTAIAMDKSIMVEAHDY